MLKLHKDSHIDHNLTQAQVDHILATFRDKEGGFIETIELPERLGTVPCSLFGPVMGDPPVLESDVFYESRGNRAYKSRLVRREARQVRQVTVIAGPHDGLACVWYTAFGGPLSPKEPGDSTPESLAESEVFWKTHALAV